MTFVTNPSSLFNHHPRWPCSGGCYIVQDLSAGPWEGGAGPTVGFVFGRTAGFGRRAGGFSCTPILGATAGLKVLNVSLEELVLRRIWGSELLRATLCKGLSDSVEVAGVGEFFTCSKVSSTTSGACFAVLCLSSSRSSFKAVFIVSSISWAIVSGSSGLWSLKPEYCPDDVDLLIGGLSIFLRESWRLMLVRLPWPGRRLLSGLSLLRPRFCSRPRGWLPRLGDPRSIEELERPCGGWRGQWPSLVLPGRLAGGGGSPLFLCLAK